MAEVETLAEVIERADDRWQHGIGAGGFSPPETAWEQALAAAVLSWLASVLADDATVEVVTDAIMDVRDAYPRNPIDADSLDVALAALAALSAHLTAPARAGDTSGEEAGRG